MCKSKESKKVPVLVERSWPTMFIYRPNSQGFNNFAEIIEQTEGVQGFAEVEYYDLYTRKMRRKNLVLHKYSGKVYANPLDTIVYEEDDFHTSKAFQLPWEYVASAYVFPLLKFEQSLSVDLVNRVDEEVPLNPVPAYINDPGEEQVKKLFDLVEYDKNCERWFEVQFYDTKQRKVEIKMVQLKLDKGELKYSIDPGDDDENFVELPLNLVQFIVPYRLLVPKVKEEKESQ